MATLKIYGENGFTFRFFDTLIRQESVQPGLLLEFLGNLKRFDDGRRKFGVDAISKDAEADVWLFPNFGKRDGFGEPDAVLLIDSHAFWFEVETRVNLASTSARHQLRQMFRFHCAARAFAAHRESELVCSGLTVSDSDEPKKAQLRLVRHQAAILVDKLRRASQHHFVLFSVERPSGDAGWREALASLSRVQFAEWDALVDFGDKTSAFPVERAWYLYWERDLNRDKFAWIDDPTTGYVSIK